jgi:predicted extracellular nuclease
MADSEQLSVFSGQFGYLDHTLANASLTTQVTGVVPWHINADEPRALDYNDDNQPGLYSPDAYRSSDHDPVIVGLSLGEVTVQRLYLPLVVDD